MTDPQGGIIPGATVVVTNTETNTVNRTATNETGYYEVNLLNPGTYSVSVEASGFKKSVQSGAILQVAGRLAIDIQLQVGQVAETIEVTAATPLLETVSASAGRVIDSQQVTQLPFSDMNPFALSALSPGMQWTGQPEYRRPFDNGGTSSFNTAGNAGSNEYTIDGAPDTGTGRRVGFVPSSDAVEEFRLETATFDASYGHTAGATINVMSKAGTNTYHGSLFDQHWQQRWNATPHFTRLLWESNVAKGIWKPTDPKQAPGRSNQFGGTLGGPVRIPKIYNGKDKLFFMFHYDGIYQTKAETTDSINTTVPKMAWRQGDFSDLQAIDATKYTIYDPRSAQLVNGRVTRTPFPGNKGIPILNPMYKTAVDLYPTPNDVPGLVTPEGTNNYYASAMPKNEKFNAMVNRIDYNLSDRHRIFGRWYWNHRLADEYDWMYETKRGLQSNGLTRINKGVGVDYIWTISNTTVMDLGVNATRFNEGGQNNVATSYKPSDFGLPKYLDDKAGAYHEVPRIDISNIASITGGNSGYPGISTRGTIGEAKVQMTSLKGAHSFKYGYNERRYWLTAASPGYSSGRFQFDNSYMRETDTTNTASNTGLSWAAFMMALPTNGVSIDTNDSFFATTRFRALYFQDDWRLTDKTRVSLGVRYEREGGITERFNRGLAGGLDTSYRPPFADAVEAAYAKNPIPDLSAAQFKLLGGFDYLGQPNKTYTDGTHHFLPRLGFVRQISSKTVVRAGYGWYYDTFNVTNDSGRTDGYTQPTSTTLSDDRGLTLRTGGPLAGLTAANNPLIDPFPVRADGTRFDSILGNSLGPLISQGRGWSFRPRDYSPAWQQRWRVGLQRELRRDMVLEVSYNGAYSRIPNPGQVVSYIPQQYWNSGNSRNQAVDDYLNATFPNPFNVSNFASLKNTDPKAYNFLNTVGFFTGSTIRRYQLMRAYPNMNGLTGIRPGESFADDRGVNKYHDMQVQFEKRMSKGLQTAVMYTRAYDWVRDYYANDYDTQLSWRPGNDVRPHRFVWQAIYELPFGKGRTWVTRSPLQHVVGGWQLSWIYQYQTGPATGWSNRYFYGDQSQLGALFNHDQVHSQNIHMWFDPSIAYQTGTGPIPSSFVGFEGRSAYQAAGWQTRVFPTRLDVLREDGIRNWDVKIDRKFRITERLRTAMSVDLLNATNHTNFSGPNTDPTSKSFGTVSSQRGLSRIIQLNLRIEF